MLSDAFKNAHGQLHADLGVSKDHKLTKEDLKAAIKRGGRTAKRAQAALNMMNARGK